MFATKTNTRTGMPHFAIAAAAVAGISAAAPALADDVTLRLGHRWPANHYIQTQLIDPFTSAVTERTGGSVTFEIYPAAQLGGDIPATMHSGLMDIGAIATGSHPDLFPLAPVGELPQGAGSACEGSARIGALVRPGGILDQQEWAPQGFRVLTASMLAPYVLFMRTTEVHSLDDVAGEKIWASGPAAETAIRAMNGVPIRIPSTELFDSASRGTVDGAIFPYSGIMQYGLVPTLSTAVHGVNFGSGVFFLAINIDQWDELDAQQQEVIQQAAHEAETAFCAYIDASDAEQSAAAAATEGFTAVTLEGEALDNFNAVLNGVAEAWAAQLDAVGRSGTEVLQAYRAVEVE